MGDISQYESVNFQLGPNINCFVKSDNPSYGTYIYHTIRSITGSGPMYTNATDFVCTTDPQITWGDFLANTLTLFLEPGVSQGSIVIPSGITTIANAFLNGFYFTSLSLPEGLTSIGNKAFGPHTNVSNGRSPITSIVIPSTVTHIGQAAFSKANWLESITIRNQNYEMEDYGNTVDTGIFWVGIGAGSNLDPDGYFITDLTSGSLAKQFDWYNKFHRVVDQVPGAILRLGHMGNIVEINGYSSGLLPFEHLGRLYWMKECQDGDANQSPLVIKHNGTLHYISK